MEVNVFWSKHVHSSVELKTLLCDQLSHPDVQARAFCVDIPEIRSCCDASKNIRIRIIPAIVVRTNTGVQLYQGDDTFSWAIRNDLIERAQEEEIPEERKQPVPENLSHHPHIPEPAHSMERQPSDLSEEPHIVGLRTDMKNDQLTFKITNPEAKIDDQLVKDMQDPVPNASNGVQIDKMPISKLRPENPRTATMLQVDRTKAQQLYGRYQRKIEA